MDSIYTDVRSACLWLAVLASVIGGFKIFQKWNRAEPVVPLIFTWVFGMVMSLIVLELVDFYFKAGYIYGQNATGAIKGLSIQAHQAALVVGVIISIFSVVSIYQKINDGEDVYNLIYKWLGSLIFLFFFGYLIEAIF